MRDVWPWRKASEAPEKLPPCLARVWYKFCSADTINCIILMRYDSEWLDGPTGLPLERFIVVTHYILESDIPGPTLPEKDDE